MRFVDVIMPSAPNDFVDRRINPWARDTGTMDCNMSNLVGDVCRCRLKQNFRVVVEVNQVWNTTHMRSDELSQHTTGVIKLLVLAFTFTVDTLGS